jgi:hypothetical protein
MNNFEIMMAFVCGVLVILVTLVGIFGRPTKADRTKGQIMYTQKNLRSRSRCRIW